MNSFSNRRHIFYGHMASELCNLLYYIVLNLYGHGFFFEDYSSSKIKRMLVFLASVFQSHELFHHNGISDR